MPSKNKISFTHNLPKTIYSDVVDMPDPMLLGITIHYYNHSDSTLYMKIFGSGSGWSSNSVEMGSLTSGNNDYCNLDNFLSRTKPASATTETIMLTLKGYSDAGYTTEVYSFSRSVTVIFIKSDDGTWTTDYNDNFDDGTVQGWSHDADSGTSGLSVVSDFVLSPPYSIRLSGENINPTMVYIYKSITTPNRATVYAIANVRLYVSTSFMRCLQVKNSDTVLLQLGKDTKASATLIPISKWMRIVVPLPTNTVVDLRYRFRINWITIAYMHFDDFKVVSK